MDSGALQAELQAFDAEAAARKAAAQAVTIPLGVEMSNEDAIAVARARPPVLVQRARDPRWLAAGVVFVMLGCLSGALTYTWLTAEVVETAPPSPGGLFVVERG
jgi:hypothetical protein